MPEAYARACNRSDSRLSFEQTSVRHTSPEVFDLVLCLDVFEHVEDYFTFLRDLRNYGKNFIFHIPLDMNAQMVARGSPIIKVRERVGHLHYFSKYTALASLEYCGYHILLDFYTKSWESQYGGLAFKLFGLIRALGLKVAPDLSSRLLGGMPLMVLAEGMATSGEGTGE